MKGKPILRLILGDQLNINHSWFTQAPDVAEYALMEVREEATYVTHHIQKIVGFFAAMRLFADELTSRGFTVRYIRLDDSANRHSFVDNIAALLESGRFGAFEYQAPDEYRVDKALKALGPKLSVPTTRVDSEHFLVEPDFFRKVFEGHKRYTMELFYREVRKRYDLLMEGGKPIGGQWNFDTENRNKLPRDLVPPAPRDFPRDVAEFVTMIERAGIPSIGSIEQGRFCWPLTRAEALDTLDYFCRELLPDFGRYQDAMHTDYRFLFHSRLSFALNVKLISPLETVTRAIEAWRDSAGKISIEQIEGFVRQIVGWREFMRGIYWTQMPRYATLNVLGASRPLPGYFWSGDTKMNCLRHAISQSLEEGYAHHIQRLMITGNFCTLTGIDPAEVDRWYLGIYVDAIEWVQLPNTRGMSQFADGGIVGTKPYTSSGQYINRMSNYCGECFYNVKEKFGERGCPFNTLYWDFLMRHREKLESNPRIGMGYRQIDKMTPRDRAAMQSKAAEILERIEDL